MRVKKGFTFVELLIVISIIGIVLPAFFGIIFVLLRQQVLVYRLSEVKRQGDYALNLMENTIRNSAVSVHKDSTLQEDDPPAILNNRLCDTTLLDTIYPSSPAVRFKDKYDNWFYYGLSSEKIASSSGRGGSAINTAELTNGSASITNLSITCRQSTDFSTSVVGIEFDIGYRLANGITPMPEERATLHYQTKIKLRTD